MQLVWFKTADLRVNDNSALYHASKLGDVLAVFCITPQQYQLHNDAPIKQDFWYRNLKALSDKLNELNIPLLLPVVESFADVPLAINKILRAHKIQHLHFNQQYEVNEKELENRVIDECNSNHIRCTSYVDQVIFEPGKILTGKNTYYTVFTPFKRNFLKRLDQNPVLVLPKPEKQQRLSINPDVIQAWQSEREIRSDLWPAGEAEARKRLTLFIQVKVSHYKKHRDYPNIAGTSTLSPYLAAGVISIRQCFKALENLAQSIELEGVQTWQSELIWREFYKHILVAFPRVSRHKAFKTGTENVVWHENESHLMAWKNGETGIPIVDAAMRQLQQTGWMHNRLRMVVAMFLSKNLFLDWRLGEEYFMQNLIDGDLAANNGGWQWSASTGTDAAPYFRIFNPVSQSQRFDPDGRFIRKFIPELATLDNKSIHQPWLNKDFIKKSKYPEPIVDLKITRQYAIDQFKLLAK